MPENSGLIQMAEKMKDCYQVTGKDFPVPNMQKGVDAGPQGLVSESAKQMAPSDNASDGHGPAVWGKEGKAFGSSVNKGESDMQATDESPTFAGKKSASLSVDCVSGQSVPSVKDDRI